MGIFSKSLSKELGKNTGKWVSNKVFGDGHSTPYRLKIQRERERQERQTEKRKDIEDRRKQREEAREYKLRQKEEQRGQREKEKQIAALEKKERIEANKKEVREFKNYIEVIQSVHKDWSDAVDWNEIINKEPPDEVLPAEARVEYFRKFTDDQIDKRIQEVKSEMELSIGKKAFDKFFSNSGGFLSKTFFKEDHERLDELKNRIALLEKKRTTWFEEYMQEQQEEYEQYLKDLEDHKLLMQIADGVLKGRTQSFVYALNFFNPFEDLNEFGSHFSFEAFPGGIEVEFFPHGDDVIPQTIKSTIKKGHEISEKPINQNIANEIYQDYICSCILRIAKEVFQLLLVNKVSVHAHSELLNTSTGNMQDSIIVSCVINRDELDVLNFDLLDPSDSFKNFKHNMSFSKSKGFESVKRLSETQVFTSKQKKETFAPHAVTSAETHLAFKSSMTVLKIKDQFLNFYGQQIEILTKKGNPAGDNRKLRALTNIDLSSEIRIQVKEMSDEFLSEIEEATGLKIQRV